MATYYRCDRCGAEAPFHLDLEVGERVHRRAQPDDFDEVVTEHKLLDLCAGCMARAVKFLTAGMGHALKAAWVDFALKRDEA